MQNIYNPMFWLSIRPGELSPYVFNLFAYTVLGLLLLTVIFAIIKKTAKKSHFNKLLSSIYTLFFTNTIIGVLLMLFTYELTPFLSSRFWFLLWGIGNIVWIVFIIKKAFAVTERKQELEKEKEYKKYLPSKNK